MKKIFLVVAVLIALTSNSFGCKTADLIAAMSANGGNLPASLMLFGRPITQCDWLTPDGRFRIHYDTTGMLAVYHPNEDVAPVDGIPDYVNRAADYLALCYGTYIQQIGFLAPPFDGSNGGDSLYDIYFTDVLGQTTPEDISEQYPDHPAYTSFIELGHDLRYPSRYGEDPLPFLKANIAHEFFHAVEFSYRAYSADYTPWWFEACANWGEEQVFDDLNDVFYNLPAYLQNPYRSLYFTGGQYYYGAWLFPEYLDERFGPSIIRECWQQFVDFNFSITAIDFALYSRSSNFNDEYAHHIIWNYFTGPQYHDGFYAEGASFGTTVFVSKDYSEYPVEWTANPDPLENVATTYIVFRNPGITQGSLYIIYTSPSDHREAVDIVTVGQDGEINSQIYDIQIGRPSTFIVPDFASDEKVIMMPIWAYEGYPKFGAITYTFMAYIDTVATEIDGPQTVSSKFELNGAYPNPFNSAVAISFNSPAAQNYTFTVYDIAGRQLFSDDGQSRSGVNIINWHANPEAASGILYYIIDLDNQKLAGRMTFVK